MAKLRLVLLGLGALAGLLLAASGLITDTSVRLLRDPPAAVARVGETLISRERFEAVLQDLASDSREPLDAFDREFVVNRLIDEELLIQRGIDLGMVDASPEIRKVLAASVIALITAEVTAAAPVESDLRGLYESDPDFFRSGARYHVRWQRIEGESEESKRAAEQWYQQWQSGLDPEPGDARSAQILPDTLLPLSKIRDYLGAELAMVIGALHTGEIAPPIAVDGAWHVVRVLAFEPGVLPSFNDARPQLEAEWQRRKSDEALRDYLLWLRENYDIEIYTEQVQQP